MKKNIFAIFTILILLTTCRAPVDNFEFGTLNDPAVIDDWDTTIAAAKGTLLIASIDLPGDNTLNNSAGQIVRIKFDQKIDEATVAGGIKVYNLENTATTQPVSPTDPLFFKPFIRSVVVPTEIKVMDYEVFLTLDLSDAADLIEVEFLGNILTGENGRYIADFNTNDIRGEAGDVRIEYLDVSVDPAIGAIAPVDLETASPVLPGLRRDPSATVNYAYAGLASGTWAAAEYNTNAAATCYSFTVTDTGSSATANKIAIAAEAVKVYENINGAWIPVPVNTPLSYNVSLPDTGIITPASGSISAAGKSYKVEIYKYYIYESEAVLGYVHRASYDAKAAPEVHYYNWVSDVAAKTTTVGLTCTDGYIEEGLMWVEVVSTIPIDMSTINLDTVRIKSDDYTVFNGGVNYNAYLPWTRVEAVGAYSADGMDNLIQRIRFYLPSYVRTSTSGWIYFAPSVRTMDSISIPANSRISFGTPSVTFDGWTRKSW